MNWMRVRFRAKGVRCQKMRTSKRTSHFERWEQCWRIATSNLSHTIIWTDALKDMHSALCWIPRTAQGKVRLRCGSAADALVVTWPQVVDPQLNQGFKLQENQAFLAVSWFPVFQPWKIRVFHSSIVNFFRTAMFHRGYNPFWQLAKNDDMGLNIAYKIPRFSLFHFETS